LNPPGGSSHDSQGIQAPRLHTDASHRFERGADFESTIASTDRVAELILASGGGNLIGDIIDVVVGGRDQARLF